MRDIFLTNNRQTVRNTSLGAVALSALLGMTIAPQVARGQAIDNAANPSAVVPAVGYRSVFKETSLGVERETRDWRKANEEVGKFLRGHVDILKWEEQEIAKTKKEPVGKPSQEPMAAPTKPEATKTIAAPTHNH